jgi:hypothetical protein
MAALQIIQVVLNNKKNIFSSGISSVQIYKFAVKLFSQQVKFSLLLESFFLSFLGILT